MFSASVFLPREIIGETITNRYHLQQGHDNNISFGSVPSLFALYNENRIISAVRTSQHNINSSIILFIDVNVVHWTMPIPCQPVFMTTVIITKYTSLDNNILKTATTTLTDVTHHHNLFVY